MSGNQTSRQVRLEFHPDPNKLWPDYYYLYPIPLNQMVLNPNIKQNPGWE